MADNVVLNPGVGGDTIASDDIGGVKFQRVKATWGPDGTATDVDSGANALPIQDGGNSITTDSLVGGATGDAAVTGDNTGSLSAKLRGINKILADVWDSTNHRILVDGSGVTQPISASALPLPAGAATSAKQPALGTAGTASADIISVQGIAGMTTVLVTPDSVALPANQSVNIAQMNGVATTMGAGAVGTGVQRTTLASDDPAVATLGAISGAAVITDANGTIQQYLRGIIKQLITAGAAWFTPVPDTANGWDTAIFTSSDGSTALTATAQVIKASAGKLGGYYIYNPNATATYVHFYNVAAASVTVGTTNPKVTLCIPATSAANLELVMGIPFSNAGWSIAATTTGPGNTAPGTALEAMVWYK